MSADTTTQQRFLEVVDQYSPLIYKVCYMYSTDHGHLKDLYQEVMANLWQGMDSFRSEAKLSTWIYRVAINTCVSYIRRNSKHDSNMPLNEAAYGIADASDERSRQLRMMYDMIGRLNRVDKAIIMLWLDEYSYDDIASLTGMTRSNVASRLHRIKQKLSSAGAE